jgi:hypothetical protein
MMARRGDDAAVLMTARDSDSPILPVDEMERLYQFRPDVVDWVLEQTKIEAESRRQLQRECHLRLLAERRLGQIFGFLMGISGIIGGSYVAVNGSPTAGGIIATSAICTLTVAFLDRKKKEDEE